MTFSGKTILITGASTGIGKALTENLSREESKLVLIARRIELLKELKRSLNDAPAEIEIYKCDVRKKDNVKEVFSHIRLNNDKIDIAVLNAGIGRTVSIENYSSDIAEEILGVNILGIIYCVEELMPGMIEQRSGIIAGVSSLADNRGHSGSGFYCASKAAATIYLDGLRTELAPYDIKVITIKPGFVDTPMTKKNHYKMPFLISAEKSAEIITRGLAKRKKIIQFPLPAVIGSKMIGAMPVWLYDKLAAKRRK